MRYSASLLLVVLVADISLLAQEKPTWIATPGYVFQQNKAYPLTIEVRLSMNACPKSQMTQGDNYSVVVTGSGVTASAPTVAACGLSTTLAISSGAQPGAQMLVVKKGDADSGFAIFDFMDATAGPTPSTPQVDVLWEILTEHLCRDNFGNHMPRDLYCVEVKIGNNSGHSLQIAGVGFLRKTTICDDDSNKENDPDRCGANGTVDVSTPNVSYQTVRASAQAGQSTTARNIIVNGTQALGLLMASFTPYFKNSNNNARWATGATIVGTTLSQAINLVAPDADFEGNQQPR